MTQTLTQPLYLSQQHLCPAPPARMLFCLQHLCSFKTHVAPEGQKVPFIETADLIDLSSELNSSQRWIYQLGTKIKLYLSSRFLLVRLSFQHKLFKSCARPFLSSQGVQTQLSPFRNSPRPVLHRKSRPGIAVQRRTGQPAGIIVHLAASFAAVS